MKDTKIISRILESTIVGLYLIAPPKAWGLTCGTILNPLTVTASAVNFGNYSPTNPSNTTANGSISVNCTIGIDVLPSLDISMSTGASGTYTSREMNGSSVLSYNLYTSGAFTNVWGDGTGGTSTQSYSSLLLLGGVTYTVYGLLPASQFIAPGAYTDTIVVTVTY